MEYRTQGYKVTGYRILQKECFSMLDVDYDGVMLLGSVNY